MNIRKILLFVVLLGVASLIGCDKSNTHSDAEIMAEDKEHGLVSVTSSEGDEKKIRYWTCVMHPSVKMPDPGSCPVCKMDLIPIYEGVGLTLTEKQKALIPIRTEPVEFRKITREIRTVGILDYNETQIAYASTRISGWIERLHVDFTGIKVRKGDELLSIYSPELLAAQEEYLTALKSLNATASIHQMGRPRAASEENELQNTHLTDFRRTIEQTLSATKSKLELYGLAPKQIEEIREHGKARTELPLYSPIGGTVIEMNVHKGQHVNRGMNLYKIVNLSSLWIMADVYEYELPWLYMGQDIEITTMSMPDQTFHGKISYIYPFLHAPTRTQKVLIVVPNPDRQLRPGMYVNIRFKSTLAEIYAHEAHPSEPYACPMHPWLTSTFPEQCAICGMDLESTHPMSAIDGPMKTIWTCPMHPEIQQDEFGECSICGMDLIEKQVPTKVTAATKTIWTCPMHPEIQQDEFGECSICGMDLIEKQVLIKATPDANAEHSTSTTMRSEPLPIIFKYDCPEHPDDYATVPGKCPKDGKELVMTGEALSVPKSAVIDTGLRQIVFVDRGESGYEQVEVKLGPEAWVEVATHKGHVTKRRYYPIINGPAPGDMVVTNGNFLLDSQTQLTGSAAGAYGGAIGDK